MLILTRRLGEAVVLGDRVMVTLVRLRPEMVELTIQPTVGGPSVLVGVRLGEVADLGFGLRVTLVEVRAASVCGGGSCRGPKARLGFAVPANVGVSRREVWEVSGGCGLAGYFARPDGEPSAN